MRLENLYLDEGWRSAAMAAALTAAAGGLAVSPFLAKHEANKARQRQAISRLEPKTEPKDEPWAAAVEEPAETPAEAQPQPAETQSAETLAWGAKVSSTFKSKVVVMAADLGVNPDYLMAAMAFETGGTFRSDIKNMAGSGAVGLIQFMPSTAKGLGTSSGALAGMTPERQLDYVYKYMKPYANRLHTLEDVYMAILYPRAIGKGSDYPMFTKGKTYSQNAGLDINKDHVVTPGEAAAKVRRMLKLGLQHKG